MVFGEYQNIGHEAWVYQTGRNMHNRWIHVCWHNIWNPAYASTNAINLLRLLSWQQPTIIILTRNEKISMKGCWTPQCVLGSWFHNNNTSKITAAFCSLNYYKMHIVPVHHFLVCV